MRKTSFGFSFLVFVLVSASAQAQFANKRIGFEAGGFTFNDREITAGLAVQIEGSYYIENGFTIGVRVPAILFLTRESNRQLFGTGGQLYFNYLFSEESIRPYAGLAIDVLYIFRGQVQGDLSGNQQIFWGPQAMGGIDFFPSDSFSIGLRGFFTLYIGINNNNVLRPGGGGFANIYFYF